MHKYLFALMAVPGQAPDGRNESYGIQQGLIPGVAPPKDRNPSSIPLAPDLINTEEGYGDEGPVEVVKPKPSKGALSSEDGLAIK